MRISVLHFYTERVFFSLGGFTDHVKKNAGKCRLIEIDEMYILF